jgi:hypothetical protein
MTNAIDTFKSLVVSNCNGYGCFQTTEAGEPYHEALWGFCVNDEDLSIPELGIDFTVHESRRTNVDLCESKLTYDYIVDFRDNATGQDYVLSTAVYKATDRSYGEMHVAEASTETAVSAPAAPASTLSAVKAQILVETIGSYFSTHGRELLVDSSTEEGDALGDLMCSPDNGDTLTLGGYQFEVTDTDEDVTNESDGWSLGSGSIELTEVNEGFKVSIYTDLFLGQGSEIRGVTISCGDAVFRKNA